MPAPEILSSRFRPFIGRFLLLWVCASTFLSLATSAGTPHLLNASFDVSREFYADYNLLFTKQFHQKTGVLARVYQSHAGSSKQARAVLEGFPADVVTMNQPLDIEMIAREDSRLIARDWRSRFQWDSSPCTTTVVFLVRAGNPKKICDWNDLVRQGVQIVIASPKTSGNGRYAYLAAWGYAAQGGAGDDDCIPAGDGHEERDPRAVGAGRLRTYSRNRRRWMGQRRYWASERRRRAT